MVDGFRMMRRIVEAAPMDALSRRGVFARQRRARATTRSSTWIRNNSQTAYHPIGTCRMGPRAQHRGRRQAQGARPRGPAHRRRLDLPDHAVGQHQCALHHGRREVRRPAPQRGVRAGRARVSRPVCRERLACHRILLKSPCLPRPSLKRPAPATPSAIKASRPLYHS